MLLGCLEEIPEVKQGKKNNLFQVKQSWHWNLVRLLVFKIVGKEVVQRCKRLNWLHACKMHVYPETVSRLLLSRGKYFQPDRCAGWCPAVPTCLATGRRPTCEVFYTSDFLLPLFLSLFLTSGAVKLKWVLVT